MCEGATGWTALASGSQSDFASVGHLVMSADIFGCHNWGKEDAATGIYWVKVLEASSTQPAKHRTAPTQHQPLHNRELSSPARPVVLTLKTLV